MSTDYMITEIEQSMGKVNKLGNSGGNNSGNIYSL